MSENKKIATPFTLRPYQQECVDAVNALPEGSRALCDLATGLGKTVCFSQFDRMGGRMLILSHRQELVKQPGKYFDCSFGVEMGNSHAKGTDEVVSASIQSIARESRLRRFKPNDFAVIVIDEAHHAAARSYQDVLQYFKPKKLIGMTATPKRGDGLALDNTFDKIIVKESVK